VERGGQDETTEIVLRTKIIATALGCQDEKEQRKEGKEKTKIKKQGCSAVVNTTREPAFGPPDGRVREHGTRVLQMGASRGGREKNAEDEQERKKRESFNLGSQARLKAKKRGCRT